MNVGEEGLDIIGEREGLFVRQNGIYFGLGDPKMKPKFIDCELSQIKNTIKIGEVGRGKAFSYLNSNKCIDMHSKGNDETVHMDIEKVIKELFQYADKLKGEGVYVGVDPEAPEKIRLIDFQTGKDKRIPKK